MAGAGVIGRCKSDVKASFTAAMQGSDLRPAWKNYRRRFQTIMA
jgi:hypothetical protein